MNTYKTIAALQKVIKMAVDDLNEADAEGDISGFSTASDVITLATKALQTAQLYAIESSEELEAEGALP